MELMVVNIKEPILNNVFMAVINSVVQFFVGSAWELLKKKIKEDISGIVNQIAVFLKTRF